MTERVAALSALGEYLNELDEQSREAVFRKAEQENPWFTRENINRSWENVLSYLDGQSLRKWVAPYSFPESSGKTVGLVMAGNIPLVGFHDLLCVLVAGHTALVKVSSQDRALMTFLVDSLMEVQPLLGQRVRIAERLNAMEAVIATGSDNSSRYFEYYFAKIPHIIRMNRTSVAIITGEEHEEDLLSLGEDIYSYFGLGCRNVSKLFVPAGYDMSRLLDALQPYTYLLEHFKYKNNYDYHKSILLVNKEAHLDAGFSLFRESSELVSPLSMVYFETYGNEAFLSQRLLENKQKIQAIASYKGQYPGSLPFGTLQKPGLNDYADRVDTLRFLNELS